MQSSSEHSVVKTEPSVGVLTSSTRKRVARACDECRLHKARCDGTTSCTTCCQNGRVCSYSLLPSDTKGPNARVKILQQRLHKAQQLIQDLQKQVPGQVTLEENNQQDLTTTELIAAAADPGITATSHADLPSDSEHDKHSIFSSKTLIHSLLRSVADNNNITALLTYATAHFICPSSLAKQDPMIQTFCQLTPYSTMLDIVYAAFSNVFALSIIVPEQDFRVRAQRLYDISPIAYQPSDTLFMPLFFAVIALGMIHSSNLHPNLDYHQILRESESYSRAAIATVSAGREYESPIHLQVALCRVLYLLNTSRLDLANSALHVACRSFMVQQLIRSVSTHDPTQINFSDMSSRGIVWAVFYLDMHISSLLNVPPFLPPPGPELATVYAINTAIYNVANYRRTESIFLYSVAVAMAIELMKLARSMPCNPERFKELNSQQSMKGKVIAQNPPNRDEVRKQCETWEVLLKAAFPDGECNPCLLMARRELQMYFHLVQITLYHSAIGTRSEPVLWNHVPRVNEFKEENACVDAAIDAVKYTSSYLEQGQTAMITWHSAYTVFISAITLLTAAVHMNASDHAATQGVINTAIMILTNTSYGSWHAKSCYIQFTQTLSNILKRPQSHSGPSTIAPNTTRRSSFSSDTSTLVALNDIFTPSSYQSSHKSSRSISYRTPNLGIVQPVTGTAESSINLGSEWGFD